MPELDEDTSNEAAKIRGWHATFLLELGVSPDTVCEHADDVDPHKVARLIGNGCPPDLAVEIIR